MTKSQAKTDNIIKINEFSFNIDKVKEENADKIDSYVLKHMKKVYFKGEVIDEYVEVNPNIITNQFFKPIIPLTASISYNGEQLSMLYEYYNDLLLDINDYIGSFPTSLTLFCRLIGVTLDDFKLLREEGDETTKLVVQKIIDDIDDSNLAMAQTGSLKEKPTLFRLKAQNGMIEKVTPKVSVNIKANIDDNRIKGNILDYEEFLGKKG